jgi:hypothetical protein
MSILRYYRIQNPKERRRIFFAYIIAIKLINANFYFYFHHRHKSKIKLRIKNCESKIAKETTSNETNHYLKHKLPIVAF